MSEISDSFRAGRLGKLQDFLARRRGPLKDYLSAISGSGGRLVFSLPGSPHACRLALEKLIIPEMGHLLREVNR